MRNKSYFIVLLVLLSLNVFAQSDTTYWQKSFSGGINFNQATFNNWSGGGVNSLALGAIVNARALYQKEKWSWDNIAGLQLGYVNQEGKNRKAADQMLLNTIVGYKIGKKWDAFMSATFNSFFMPGYRYDKPFRDGTTREASGEAFKVSQFLAPGQLTLAWGVAYKPNDWFSLRLSPFAPRFTFLTTDKVRFQENADSLIRGSQYTTYGVEAGKKVYTELLAFQLQASLNKNLSDNVSIKAEYFMYDNYQKIGSIDNRLNLLLAAKLTKLLSATFGLNLVYDDDFSGKLQVQQTLGIGFLYNASTFKK
jgi:hypothetical protein